MQDFIDGKLLGNAHIFVNSVSFISKVIKRLNLKPDSVKIVCSKNEKKEKNQKKNQTKLGRKYTIAEPQDKIKKINFYTSTCFEGCDIYDIEGRTYIVSEGYKAQTLLDISTLLIQICGRIRNSQYRDKIIHIYSNTRYENSLGLDEFEKYTLNKFRESNGNVDIINSLPYENRQ